MDNDTEFKRLKQRVEQLESSMLAVRRDLLKTSETLVNVTDKMIKVIESLRNNR